MLEDGELKRRRTIKEVSSRQRKKVLGKQTKEDPTKLGEVDQEAVQIAKTIANLVNPTKEELKNKPN